MAEGRAALASALCYLDPRAALAWLEAAFGFEVSMLIEDGEGKPQTRCYGDRTYRGRDPGGHIWTRAQAVETVTREQAGEASGLKIKGWV